MAFESVYERTMDVSRFGAPPPAEPPPTRDRLHFPALSVAALPAMTVAGLAAAAAVLVAAVLLLVGVI